jgi:diacylglycerol kinase (ATP)
MAPVGNARAMNLPHLGRAKPITGQCAQPRGLPRLPRVGVIINLHSQGNQSDRRRALNLPEALIIQLAPPNRSMLDEAMRTFVEEAVELIVIDGGDGTVREVVSAAHRAFGVNLPRFAIVRSGKTNALAMDLGVPENWTLEQIIVSHCMDHVIERRPIHIRWNSKTHPDLFGFIFGFGAYSRATLLAQRVHKWGMFNGVAIFVTLSWALLQTILGGLRTPWTRGEAVRIYHRGDDIMSERLYLMLCSTLHDQPIPVRPFGKPRQGLKFLTIPAPPRRLWRYLPAILAGTRTKWLEEHGILRRDVEQLVICIRRSFIVDGERFPGGNLTITHAAPIEFVVP